MLGISTDEIEQILAFSKRYNFPFPLLSDSERQVCMSYGACDRADTIHAKRMTYIIGADRQILQLYIDVNPEGHVEEILAFFDGITSSTQQDALSVEYTKPQSCSCKEITDEGSVGMSEQQQVGKEFQSHDLVTTEQQELTAPLSTIPTIQMVVQQGGAVLNQVTPSANGNGNTSLVYALGTLGVEFASEARRDSIRQHMGDGANPHDPRQLLVYLEENPWDGAAIIWTLSLDTTPIYAIQPQGAYAAQGYERLRQFLTEQLEEGVERVSIPGMIMGQTMLMSGQVVPVILPTLRCMYSWTTSALVEAVCGTNPDEVALQGVTSFLERVYYELRNLGITPQERAINYAATNAFNIERIFEVAMKEEIELEEIGVERSPLCRPDSDCWDVKLTFFHPGKVFEQARKVYRFTIDVSDVCPVTVGSIRSWFVR